MPATDEVVEVCPIHKIGMQRDAVHLGDGKVGWGKAFCPHCVLLESTKESRRGIGDPGA